MKLDVQFFKTEAELDDAVQFDMCDASGFAEDGTRHPNGYHAYKITGSASALDQVEDLLQIYAPGSWRTFRFHGHTKDVLCVEIL